MQVGEIPEVPKKVGLVYWVGIRQRGQRRVRRGDWPEGVLFSRGSYQKSSVKPTGRGPTQEQQENLTFSMRLGLAQTLNRIRGKMGSTSRRGS